MHKTMSYLICLLRNYKYQLIIVKNVLFYLNQLQKCIFRTSIFYVFRKIWLIMKYFKKTMVLIYYI